MSQVLRTMMNCVLQLNACLDLKGCLTIGEVQDGSWYMWTTRMMFYLLGMIPGSKFIFSILKFHANGYIKIDVPEL